MSQTQLDLLDPRNPGGLPPDAQATPNDLLATTDIGAAAAPARAGVEIQPEFHDANDLPDIMEGIIYNPNDRMSEDHPLAGHYPPELLDIPSGIPGVPPRPISSLLSAEDRNALVEQLLKTERAEAVDSRHLVLEFGPLAPLEARMRAITRDFVDAEMAEAVTRRVRRCIHNAVVSNTLLGEKESTEAGLMARIEAVNDLEETMEADVEELLGKLQDIGLDMDPLRVALKNTIEVEQRRLEAMSKSLVPATIGTALFDAMNDFASAVKSGLSGKEALVGDVRRQRNDQLSRAMESLSEVTYELKTSAGDEEWERTHGKMAYDVSRELVEQIGNLVKGAEDQVDLAAVGNCLTTANENMIEAAELAVDEEHKARLKRMVEFIAEALKAIAAVVSKVFGRDDVAAPPKMTP